MTGKQGYSANLTAHQIINQIHSLPERDKLTNVVMMGMGEPLDNLEEVLKALDILTGPMVMHGVRSGLPFQLSDCGKDCGALSKKATVTLPSACILR